MIVYDDEYTGPRWRYGLTNRPITGAGVPKGFIVFSDRKDQRFRHGTVDYPFPLETNQIEQMELTPVGIDQAKGREE